MIKKLLKYISRNSTELNWGRKIVNNWSVNHINKILKNNSEIRVLDIGCGGGSDLISIKENVDYDKIKLTGIENYPQYHALCRERGIDVVKLNIEKSKYKFKDNYFDIVIINQVIEHTKDIFWIFSEISRILKKNGIIIVGIPNLAALHERLLLLLGIQPTVIKPLGPHIRGFTKGAFINFIETDNYFKVEKVKGSNFWPFPPFLSIPLSRIFTTLSVSLFFLVRRSEKKGEFIDILSSRFYETLYYTGNKVPKKSKN